MQEIVYLSLGSNMGNKASNLQKAVRCLAGYSSVESVSSFFYSEPVGYHEQPWFFNAVCKITTEISPFALLEKIRETEKFLGKEKRITNGPRVIDIDILLYGQWVFYGNSLIIPHPRLAERAFVLWPLSELAPDLKHPLLNVMIKDLWLARKDHLERIERVPFPFQEQKLWEENDVRGYNQQAF